MSKKLYSILWGAFLLIPNLLFAAKPVFLVTPIQKAPTTVSTGQTVTAIYQVTNNSPFVLNNNGVIDLPNGITQSGGTCSSPFSLAPGESCTLNLQIVANQLITDVHGGPIVCHKLSCPVYCSQPSVGNELNIVKSSLPTYTIGGTISNLLFDGLILQNNGGSNLSILGGATSFQFPMPVPQGSNYDVTVFEQPVSQICNISNNTGTNIMANVTNIALGCFTPAYVTNFASSNISIIDTATNTVTGTIPIPIGDFPFGLALTPVGTRLYVAESGTAHVSVIDTSTNTIVATIPVGNEPIELASNPTSTLVYVTNFSDNTVSVINTSTNTVTATIPVGTAPLGVVVNLNAPLVYVVNSSSNNVSVIDATTNTVATTIPVGNAPNQIAISIGSDTLYVTNQADGTVSVINTNTNTVVATIPVGNSPDGVIVSPSGSTVYVANTGSNNVSVIDTTTNTVTATIPVGTQPVAVGVSDDGSEVFVANRTSNNVSVINTGTNTVVATIPVGTQPESIVVR